MNADSENQRNNFVPCQVSSYLVFIFHFWKLLCRKKKSKHHVIPPPILLHRTDISIVSGKSMLLGNLFRFSAQLTLIVISSLLLGCFDSFIFLRSLFHKVTSQAMPLLRRCAIEFYPLVFVVSHSLVYWQPKIMFISRKMSLERCAFFAECQFPKPKSIEPKPEKRFPCLNSVLLCIEMRRRLPLNTHLFLCSLKYSTPYPCFREEEAYNTYHVSYFGGGCH